MPTTRSVNLYQFSLAEQPSIASTMESRGTFHGEDLSHYSLSSTWNLELLRLLVRLFRYKFCPGLPLAMLHLQFGGRANYT